MIEFAIWLASFGTADLAAGLAGQRESLRRDVGGWILGIGVAVVLATWLGLSAANRFLLSVIIGFTIASWFVLRARASESTGRALLPLVFFAVVFVAMAGTAGLWPSIDGGEAAEWLKDLPFPALSQKGIAIVMLTASFGIWLVATANALVRLVLAAIGTDVAPAEQKLRGGRVIGPIERLLVFGLAVGGEPTAAALVISAKGLLRFPELTGMRKNDGPGEYMSSQDEFDQIQDEGDETRDQGNTQEDRQRRGSRTNVPVRSIDVVTEYLLVGSMTSWILALIPLVFVTR
jgi:hypothetical protein